MTTNAAAQAARRAQLAELIRPEILTRVQRDDGRVLLDLGEHAGDGRLVLWSVRALLLGSCKERQLANELLESWTVGGACHFCGVGAMALLVSHKSEISETAARNLEAFVQRHLSDWMTDDFRFVGANDNAPLECVAILALAGEHFGKPLYVDFARDRLRQFDRMLDLRGYIHECNSPTYSGISLAVTAELAELVRDEEIKRMALRAEQRIWQEVLLHFHPNIKHQIGPFSRGYPDDNAVNCTLAMMTLWCAFGDNSPLNPPAMLFPPTPGTFAHNSWFFQHASLAAQSAATYHPPLELATQCFARSTPFSSMGSNEFMPIDGAPGGQSSVQVHAEEEYSVSSFGSRLWAGQTVPAHVLYRRHQVAESAPVEEHLAATRSLYTRCHVSDAYASMFERNDEAAQKEIYLDHAAAFTVQHESTLMIGYVPTLRVEQVRTIKASVVLPLHHSRPDEVWHGDQQLAGFSGSFREVQWSFVRDGEIFIAVHPLIAKQEDAALCSLQYSDLSTYGLISCYNMCGFQSRPINQTELRTFGSGFVIEISSQRKESFEEFRSKVLASHIQQHFHTTQRELRYAREGVDLELIYDFAQLNLRRAAANGTIVNGNVKLETSDSLPLIM